MTDRDPIEFLSPAIDRPVQPDPDFAADLLDRLLDDLVDTTGDPATAEVTPLPTDSADDTVAGKHIDHPPTVQMLHPVVEATSTRPRSRRIGIIAAAAALLVLGGLALLRLDGDLGEPLVVASVDSTTDDEPQPVATDDHTESPTPAVTATERIAIDFLAARANYDAAAMQALLADDAAIEHEYGVVTADDYAARAEFERLTNTTFSDVACDDLPSSERVSCLFSFRNDVGRHLRDTPYRAEVVVAVRDGSIVDLLGATHGIAFESDIEFFLDWLARTHPADRAAVAGTPTYSGSIEMQVTAASGAIVASHLQQFAAETEPPITTLLADDPRFATLLEGLTRTRVGDGLSFCTKGPATLFAPTNDAFDRYIAASGGDRATVLGDTALFETLVIAEVVTMTDPLSRSEATREALTWSGDRIVIMADPDPNVQGIPILGDTVDITACNGAFHGIDEIYSSND